MNATAHESPAVLPVHRFEVRVKPGLPDPRAEQVARGAASLGLDVTAVRACRVYLVEGELSGDERAMIAHRLLADPVVETVTPGVSTPATHSAVIEVHPLPGVMDPAAQSVRDAVQELLAGREVQVSTGWRYDFAGLDTGRAKEIAERLLANEVVQAVHTTPWHPKSLPHGHEYTLKVRHVPLRDLSDEQLTKLSREAHLFLSLDEMKAVQAEYRRLGREPSDIELETIAQTWSEHCVHKTLKSRVRYRSETASERDSETGRERGGAEGTVVASTSTPTMRSSNRGLSSNDTPTSTPDPITWTNRPGHTRNPDGSITIDNLLKSTVAAATFELIADGVDWALSVFKDNSGVIALDERWGVCVKVETHNHPSALEPYGGAATGAGGCIRDVIGTGQGAKPIANTDVFCVATPHHWSSADATSEGKVRSRVFAKPVENVPHSHLNAALVRAFTTKDDVYKIRSGEPGPDGTVEYQVWRGRRMPDGHKEFVGEPLDPAIWYPHLEHAFDSPRLIRELLPGCLHPRRILTEVVSGVRDYGNRMGIPTLNGAVWFDDRYVGNPLVFCGCIGLIPRDRVHGEVKPGDRIIALGGRTGRDGIHGATFSSAELEHTAADEFSHAVQIGNAIEEKRLMDAILRARDGETGRRRDEVEEPALGIRHSAFGSETNAKCRMPNADSSFPLFHALTDCGAGGFSSAVGEMGSKIGAEVHLDRAPLKYAGLSYTEIWISEAQERMVLAVPPENVPALKKICEEERVELADLGHFGTPDRTLRLFYKGTPVGTLDTHFLHEGIPTPTREAVWGRASETARQRNSETGGKTSEVSSPPVSRPRSIAASLLSLLSHPNIASKHWIVRQYDHEVQGNTVVKPLVGHAGRGPGDASVIEPIPGSGRGVAIACGLATGVGDPAVGGDPYLMALAAIDECVRNLVCAGADPTRIAILDNFCWPSCDKPENMGSLVRAAEGCYDGAKAYRTPFVSGKDSLNNQLRYTDPATGEPRVIEIPPTLLITGLGIVPDIARGVTMDAKRAGNVLVLVGATGPEMGGSHYQRVFGLSAIASTPADETTTARVPRVDLAVGPRTARAVAELIRAGIVSAAHDCSDGGLLPCVAEMLIASPGLGLALDPAAGIAGLTTEQFAFAETPSRYVLEVEPADLPRVREVLGAHGLPTMLVLGTLNSTGRLAWPAPGVDVPVDELARAWLGPLDW